MSCPHNPIRSARRIRLSLVLLGSIAFLLDTTVAGWAHGARRKQASVSGLTLRFAHGGSAAEVPLELSSNAVFVPVRLDRGLPSGWLFDTGSRRTMAAPAAHSESATREGGSAPVLFLSGLRILGLAPGARSLKPLGPWYGRRVHGVIGDDLLTRIVAQIDYSNRSIQLYEPASYHPPRYVRKLDVRWIDGLPTVRARLRLGGRTVDGNFVLNTGGNAGVVVSEVFLVSHKMYPYKGKTIPRTIFEASGEQSVLLARGQWFQFGRWRVDGPLVAIEGGGVSPGTEGKGKQGRKDENRDFAGWIGGQILRKFQLVLDFPAHRIFLAPNDKFIFPIEADASGATIIAAGPSLDQFEIRGTVTGSPAAAAGLIPGDQILVIDGEPASNFSLDQVRELFCQAGHTPVMSVLRLGRKVRIVLHLRKQL